MFDWFGDFFQNMWDASFGAFSSWFSEMGSFFSILGNVFIAIIFLGLAFVIFKVLKYISLPAIITGQLLMTTAIITALLAFVSVLSLSFVSIYNRIYDLADYLNTGTAGDCAGYFSSCLGINGILSAYFTEIFALLIVVLLIRLSTLFIWAFSLLTDRFWRLGVLLGLA